MNLDRTFAEINTILNNAWNGIYATVASLASYKKLSDEGVPLDFGTNSTAWNYGAGQPQSSRWKFVLTSDTTPVFSNDANLSTQIGKITASNTPKLTLSSVWHPNVLPDDDEVTWDEVNYRLTFNPPSPGTVYKFIADKDADGHWDLTIVKRTA